jgi:hypothetical protein
MFAEHGEGAGGQLWAAEVRPGCNGVAGGCVRARIRELLRLFPRMPAEANRGERIGWPQRFLDRIRTNVPILPLLILTATTAGDELSYGLNDTAVDGFWIGSNCESTGVAPLADTLASIMDSAPYGGAAACVEEGGVINCK